MIRKIGAALVVAAGALAATGVAAPANASNGDKIIDAGEVVVWKDTGLTGQLYDFSNQQAVYPSVTTPSFANCPNLAGWDVNGDESGRIPEATVGGLKFDNTDLIHHAITGLTTENLHPGTYDASPAPDPAQPSFFSVEVDEGPGTYGTLRWKPSTGTWTMVANNGTNYENADPTVVVTLAGKSHKVVRFGVGYTMSPPGMTTTTVSAVHFNGTDYSLTCPLPTFGTPPNAVTAIDNNASSIGNYSTSYVRAYHDPNYLGAYLQLLPYGQSGGGLSWAYTSLGTLNDSLSSHRVAGP